MDPRETDVGRMVRNVARVRLVFALTLIGVTLCCVVAVVAAFVIAALLQIVGGG